MPFRVLVLFVCMLLVAAVAAAQAAPVITLETDPGRVKVSPVTVGGAVLIFGVGGAPTGFDRISHRWSKVVTDSDHDGAVALDLGMPLPWKSMWFAVDLHTRQSATATPAGFHLNEPETAPALQHGSGGQVDRVVSFGTRVDAVYLPPGNEDVWAIQTADGWSADQDSEDGQTTAALADFTSPAAVAPKPAAFAVDGILIVIDDYELTAAYLRLDAAAIGGAQ